MPRRINRTEITRLEDLPNIGTAIAKDLRLLKIKAPADLLSRDPYQMYEELCALTGCPHDPCLLDTFIAATDFMSGAPAKPWWKYTAGRKKKTAADSRRSFLRASVAIAGMAIFAGRSEAAQAAESTPPLMAYVGTFSSPLRDVLPTQVDLPPCNGRGIHLFQVDRETGALTAAGIAEIGTSPSCLAINAAGTRLYSANETDRSGPDKQGTVSAFAISKSDGKLTALNSVPSGGAGPTYVSLHPSGRFLLVANYFGGSVAVLPIGADGRLAAATDIKTDAGKIGPARPTHAPPGSFAFSGHDRTHAHQIAADPSGKFVLHVELALDTIYVWKFDEQKGLLSPGESHAVPFPPGDGPRHFHFHPNGRWLYVLAEEASNIVLFEYEGGRLSARQTISSLPPGFAGSSFASEILVSGDGRFVYAGNRLHDSIAVFAIGADGTLTYVGEE
jgi:6-phosphogluconolactonase (cycloisomerase 2 family)